jgi:hypothetical protein
MVGAELFFWLVVSNVLGNNDGVLSRSYDDGRASLENPTTHACVLFSNWGVHERRVGLMNLPAAFIANRPPSSANLGGHLIMLSKPCGGVRALSVNVDS